LVSLNFAHHEKSKEITMAVNPMDYTSKDLVLDVLRTEQANFTRLVEDPANWEVQTRCTDWEVRDIVGHLIDVQEGYLDRWEMARKGEPSDVHSLQVMADDVNQAARAFRNLPREEVLARFKDGSTRMLQTFDRLTADEWSNFLVNHPFMGPLPTFFYTGFQIMDYGVHNWDIKWGLGDKKARLDERTAGVLTPYMFVLMQYTVDQPTAQGVDGVFGIKVDGEWGGQWLVRLKGGEFLATPADNLEEGQALFHFQDASDFVLTSFQRFPGGETSGDPVLIDKVRHLFFRI
jgi:uncharacterized protein (TIGR03083 family)